MFKNNIDENNYNKKQLLQDLSKKTGLSKKNINNIILELQNIIKNNFKNKNIKTFTLPGIFKLIVKDIPPQKERSIINPFTKKNTIIPAKGKTQKIKIKLLKKIKDITKEQG